MKGDFEMQKIEERRGSNRFLLFMYTAVFRFKMYYTYSKKNILLRFFFFLAYRSVSKKDFLTDLSHPKYILLFFWAYRSVSKKNFLTDLSPPTNVLLFFFGLQICKQKKESLQILVTQKNI